METTAINVSQGPPSYIFVCLFVCPVGKSHLETILFFIYFVLIGLFEMADFKETILGSCQSGYFYIMSFCNYPVGHWCNDSFSLLIYPVSFVAGQAVRCGFVVLKFILCQDMCVVSCTSWHAHVFVYPAKKKKTVHTCVI